MCCSYVISVCISCFTQKQVYMQNGLIRVRRPWKLVHTILWSQITTWFICITYLKNCLFSLFSFFPTFSDFLSFLPSCAQAIFPKIQFSDFFFPFFLLGVPQSSPEFDFLKLGVSKNPEKWGKIRKQNLFGPYKWVSVHIESSKWYHPDGAILNFSVVKTDFCYLHYLSKNILVRKAKIDWIPG